VGLVAQPHDTPRGLAAAVEARFGPRGAPLAALLRTFDAQRYGRDAISRPSAPWMSAVRAELRMLTRT
jgi:hypothetical protein